VTLRELREKAELTQLEMATILGKPLRTYSRWENAKDPKIPWSRYAILKARFGL
jgi:transcriptional regulator with XRE-family HTH domain